ncbi:hypothetical protein EW146_g8059 [Bondarzewia mesenterica]|uniref:HAUS augmin-like complex subunit 6 N-terminal domain-containing protein n=1 Tax=Bondarzewia mesenterica TaxID=1095465 RepID=A0A4S4LHZ4_9AGAM|nr:hypothetical protein EW146_g8059 [Bondarzewia mesenterica]
MPLVTLPLPLLLLIHLHILQYPKADSPEYDEHVFNPQTRGLRDRARTMEDLCYFLVGKVEKTPQAAKTLLPTYPCLQPSDSTAFRTTLARYLEGLRNHVVRPDSHPDFKQSTRGKNQSNIAPVPLPVAWWWKDVVVRKSLLEECSGERFERLIIALSTHAVMNRAARLSTLHATDTSNALFQLLNLPHTYTSSIASAQAARRTWERSIALLLQRQKDLEILRNSMIDPTKIESKYSSLSTERLISLCDSRRNDLEKLHWSGDDGIRALDFIVSLAGLKPPGISSQLPFVTASVSGNTHDLNSQEFQGRTLPSLPLPTIAAHHPSHLQSLSAPLLHSASLIHSTADSIDSALTQNGGSGNNSAHNSVLIKERLDAEERNRTSMSETLSRMQVAGENLERRLGKMKEKSCVRDLEENVSLELPTCSSAGKDIDFEGKLNSETLAAVSEHHESNTPVKDRVTHLRTSVLPQYISPNPPPTSSHLPKLAPVPSLLRSNPAKASAFTDTAFQVPSTKHKLVPGDPDPPRHRPQPSRQADPPAQHKNSIIPPSKTTRTQRLRLDEPVRTSVATYGTSTPPPSVRAHPVHRPRTVKRISARLSLKRGRPSMYERTAEVQQVLTFLIALCFVMAIVATTEGTSLPLSSASAPKPKPQLILLSAAPHRSDSLLEASGLDTNLPSMPRVDLRDEMLDTDGEWVDEEQEELESDKGGRREEDDGREGELYEGKSVSLRDILVRAGDVTFAQFDILHDDEVNVADETMGWE